LVGPINLIRVRNEHGVPIAYRRMIGVELLGNPDQIGAYAKLPDQFEFKEAKRIYGREGQATTDFLEKCQAVGILKHEGRVYRKANLDVPGDDSALPQAVLPEGPDQPD
jgi:hypothetical protein